MVRELRGNSLLLCCQNCQKLFHLSSEQHKVLVGMGVDYSVCLVKFLCSTFHFLELSPVLSQIDLRNFLCS